MEAIIRGKDISCYEVTAISVAVSKNKNLDDNFSKFVVFSAEDVEGGWGSNVRSVMFEEELGAERLKVFEKFILKDPTTQQPVVDARGGQVVSLAALRKDPEAMEIVGKKLTVPGGEPQTYNLEKGECYANDKDGKPTLDKSDNPVKRKAVEIFVQIKYATVGADGQLHKNYVSGMTPEYVGQRMESRFYKHSTKEWDVVNGQFVRKTAVVPENQPEENTPTPF